VDPVLVERVAALEAAVASAKPAAAPDLSGIDARIAALEAKVAALSEQPPAPAAAGTGALPADAAQAIAALQAEVAALKSGGGAASEAMSAQAAEVKAQLEAAQSEAQKLAEASAAAAKAALAGAALSRLQPRWTAVFPTRAPWAIWAWTRFPRPWPPMPRRACPPCSR
jgi:hypothetical protein